MRQYEMTYLISDKIGENDLTAATGRINGLITARKGKVLGEDNWGRRKLAYPIKKQEFATYVTLNFELEPEELKKLGRDLRLTQEIIRFLIIVKDYGKETLKLTADEVAETEEIEEVVGGERSFEAIEGETEESYGLMAKREEIVEEAEEQNAVEEEVEQKEEAKEVTAEAVEKPKSEKKSSKKTESTEVKETEAVKAPKPTKKKTTKKTEEKEEAKDEKSEKEIKAEAEADRLAKLDEEIEGILGDDL